MNRYYSPRALFPSRRAAFDAALAVNDATRSTCCSYQLWEVEAEGLELPRFLRELRRAGCNPMHPY